MKLVKNYKDNIYGLNCDCYDIFVDENKVGIIGLFFNDGKAFFDIFISPEYRRKGYAFESKKLLIKHSGLTDIYSWVDKKNLASINLQYKMGCVLLEETDDKLLFVWRKE